MEYKKLHSTLKNVRILPSKWNNVIKDNMVPQYSGRTINNLIISMPHEEICNDDSVQHFITSGITPVVSRCDKMVIHGFGLWVNYTLNEFKNIDVASIPEQTKLYCYVDIMGHELVDVTNTIINHKVTFRVKNPTVDFKVMVGPVLSPQMFRDLALHECDYCVMVPEPYSGSSVKYPESDLITDTFTIQQEGIFDNTYIVAYVDNVKDGITALALGADHIMLAHDIAMAAESSAPLHSFNTEIKLGIKTVPITGDVTGIHKYHSSDKVMLDTAAYEYLIKTKQLNKQIRSSYWRSPHILQTIDETVTITSGYTLKQFKEYFDNELRTAMLYTNTINIDRFNPGSVECCVDQ